MQPSGACRQNCPKAWPGKVTGNFRRIMTAMFARILSIPRQSFLLLGPRGCGKSTWLRSEFNDAAWFDLLDESLFQRLLVDPGLFAGRLGIVAAGGWVVVDEVQRLPNLLNEVHRLIETRGLRFALSGSSARKLRRGGSNLLAGRALRSTMYPFMPEELGATFDIERALTFGTMPIVWSSDDPRSTLEAYGQLYLKEEIQSEALVRNLAGFARFLPVAAICHGQVTNVSNLARDTGVARTTVQGFIEILEDTLLAFQLPGYDAKLRIRERKHPKLYWIDAGLVRAAKRQLGPLAIEERGALFEGFIATLLRCYGETRNLFDEMYYWAPTENPGLEVDFLLRSGKKFLAIEVKSTRRFSRELCSGLRAIEPLPGLHGRWLVYQGPDEVRTEDGIDVLPLATFLTRVAQGRLF